MQVLPPSQLQAQPPSSCCAGAPSGGLRPDGLLRPGRKLSPAAYKQRSDASGPGCESGLPTLGAAEAKEGARRAAQPALQRRSAAVAGGVDWPISAASKAAPFAPPDTLEATRLFADLGPPFAAAISHRRRSGRCTDSPIPGLRHLVGWCWRNRQDLAERRAEGWSSAPGCQAFKGLLVLPSSPRVCGLSFALATGPGLSQDEGAWLDRACCPSCGGARPGPGLFG